MKPLFATLGLVFVTNLVVVGHAGAGPITVEDAWARATPKGAQVAAGYLTIKNEGAEPDRLVAASARFAGKTEMHQSSVVDGVMKMRPVADGIPIPPGATVALAPGGYHLMFMNLAAPLTEGETVTGELVFERAGKIEVNYAVLGMGAQGPAEGDHHQH